MTETRAVPANRLCRILDVDGSPAEGHRDPSLLMGRALMVPSVLPAAFLCWAGNRWEVAHDLMPSLALEGDEGDSDYRGWVPSSMHLCKEKMTGHWWLINHQHKQSVSCWEVEGSRSLELIRLKTNLVESVSMVREQNFQKVLAFWKITGTLGSGPKGRGESQVLAKAPLPHSLWALWEVTAST